MKAGLWTLVVWGAAGILLGGERGSPLERSGNRETVEKSANTDGPCEVTFNGAPIRQGGDLKVSPGLPNVLAVRIVPDQAAAPCHVTVTKILPDGTRGRQQVQVGLGQDHEFVLGPMTAPPQYLFEAGAVVRIGYRIELVVKDKASGDVRWHAQWSQGLARKATPWRISPSQLVPQIAIEGVPEPVPTWIHTDYSYPSCLGFLDVRPDRCPLTLKTAQWFTVSHHVKTSILAVWDEFGFHAPSIRWKALNHSIAVNRLLGVENRVAMTNREGHGPTEESNEQLYVFFEYFLKRYPAPTGPAAEDYPEQWMS